eukprot:495659_1
MAEIEDLLQKPAVWRGALDYFNDEVRSKVVHITILCSMFGPIYHATYLAFEHTGSEIAFLFLYATIGIISYIILWLISIGNNSILIPFSRLLYLMTLLSILSCIGYGCFIYYVYTTFIEHNWFNITVVYMSISCIFISFLFYVFNICYDKIDKNLQETVTTGFESTTLTTHDQRLINIRKSIIKWVEKSNTKTPKTSNLCQIFKQFIYPTIQIAENNDLDEYNQYINKNNKKLSKKYNKFEDVKNTSIVYPARLYAAVYLGIIFVLSVFYWNYNFMYNYLNNTANDIKNALDDLYEIEKQSGIKIPSLVISTCIHSQSLIQSMANGFFYGGIAAFFIGLYSSLITFKAFKKKVYNIKHHKTEYRYNPSMYPRWRTAVFMGSLASYLGFGSLLISTFIALIYGFIAWDQFGQVLKWSYLFIIGYILYYFTVFFLLHYIVFGKIFKSEQRTKYRSYWSTFLMLSDVLFMPLALSSAARRFIIWILFGIFSYMRPDINVFPHGMESLDWGPLSYISTTRIAVEIELQKIAKDTKITLFGNDEIDENKKYKNKFSASSVNDKQQILLEPSINKN